MNMQKWQYYTTTVQNDDSTGIVACLNETGAKGWELVAVAQTSDYCTPHRLYFKRLLT